METLLLIFDSTIRLSTPLLLACMAGLYSERSGIVDIGLEGKMLFAAFLAAAAASVTGSAWLGLLAGIAIALAASLFHGYASITQRGNQIVSGVALNFMAAGLTALFGNYWFGQGGKTPQLEAGQRFNELTLPFADMLKNVPVVGQFYSEVVSGHSILVYFTFAMVWATWWVLFRTRTGMRLRAVGENPAAVDTAGINVNQMRYKALIVTGVLCGIAGTYLSVAQSAGFIINMTAGKGFIALAALIFAKWNPISAMYACLLFGFLDAAAIRLQGVSLPAIGTVPVEFMQALPYIMTVVLLAGFVGRAVPPKAAGIPYVKER